MPGSSALTWFTISSVEASPFFRIVSNAEAIAVLTNDICLDCETVAHVGDVADVNHRAVYLFDRNIVQRRDSVRDCR